MHSVLRRTTAVAVLSGLATAGLVAGPASAAGGRPLSTSLLGSAEVPGPGDPDGSGTASLRVNPGQREVCYELTASGIAPATAAHIHVGGPAVAGRVVVTLGTPTSGTASGCVTVDRQLAVAIVRDPAAYYVNVHNAEYPAGALRGQLG